MTLALIPLNTIQLRKCYSVDVELPWLLSTKPTWLSSKICIVTCQGLRHKCEPRAVRMHYRNNKLREKEKKFSLDWIVIIIS